MLRFLPCCRSEEDSSEKEDGGARGLLAGFPTAEDSLGGSAIYASSPDDEWLDALQPLSKVIPDESRWRSIRDGNVVTTDRLGDLFVVRLQRLVTSPCAVVDMRRVRFVCPGFVLLLKYESEPRRLVRLARTGRAVDMVATLHRDLDAHSLAHGVPVSESLATEWPARLLQERNDRLKFYHALLADDDAFEAQVRGEIDHDRDDGEFHYALELLTVLKHDYLEYSDILLPAERDVMLAVYDRVAALAGIIVVTLPKWFASPLDIDVLDGARGEWRGAFVSVDYESAKKSGEGFVSGVAQWLGLNHPHVAKLYGACHVGKRFYVHEMTDPDGDDMTYDWQLVHQCALGLRYLLERGMPYRAFSGYVMAKSADADKFMLLHGVGMAVSRPAGDHSDNPRASDLCYLAEAVWSQFRPYDADFELSRTTVDQERPAPLTEAEWSVLAAMVTTDENDSAGMLGILHQLRQLAAESNKVASTTSLSGLYEPLRSAVVPATNSSFELMFIKLHGLFNDINEYDHALEVPVFRRLVAVYDQLQDELCSSLPAELLTSFTNIVARFYRSTVVRSEQSADSMFSSFSESCAIRSVAEKNCSYHHELDRVIASPIVDGSDPVHDWKPRWRKSQCQLVQRSPLGENIGSSSLVAATSEEGQETDELELCEEKPFGRSDRVVTDASLDERAVLTQFEATKRRGAYSADALAPLDSALARSTHSVVVPEWFIPSYEVELGEFLGQGAFGAVYRGKWFDTDVVIKILLSDTPEQRRAFVREAEVWFAIHHPNVVHLFGACHVGPRPFFVCEFAGQLTLPDFRSHRGYNAHLVYFFLHAAATGLQALHQRGIVHGDLKGNNILLCKGSLPKLADFGLSRFVRDDDEDEESDGVGALGAYRWKAPECLSGSRPTFASDVFSFAMCIIEAKTGEYPWGTMDDSVVKYHVKRGALPARPDCFSDGEWSLVTCMCCYDPSKRIDMAAVVEELDSYRRLPED